MRFHFGLSLYYEGGEVLEHVEGRDGIHSWRG